MKTKQVPLSTAAQLIIDERTRQVTAEGYDAAHDATHKDGEIARGCRFLRPSVCRPVPITW